MTKEEIKISVDLPKETNTRILKQLKPLGGLSRAAFIRIAILKYLDVCEAG